MVVPSSRVAVTPPASPGDLYDARVPPDLDTAALRFIGQYDGKP